MSVRTVFVDIDGTLVNYQDRLPESAARAVREARACGNKVCICTGRPLAQIRQEIRNLGFDGIIAGGGNYVEVGGTVVSYEALPVETVRRIVDWLLDRRIPFYLEANSGLFTSPGFETEALEHLRAYGRSNGMQGDLATVDDIIGGFTHGRKDLCLDDVNKVSFILRDPADLEAVRRAFPDLRVGTWGGRDEKPFFVEVGVLTNKGEGVRTFLAHSDVDRRDTIGIGDTHADIPLMQACGLGVAMGNSQADVKAASDLVAPDVDEDGLYRVFAKLGLLEPEKRS